MAEAELKGRCCTCAHWASSFRAVGDCKLSRTNWHKVEHKAMMATGNHGTDAVLATWAGFGCTEWEQKERNE